LAKQWQQQWANKLYWKSKRKATIGCLFLSVGLHNQRL
jgi:hypothetical protein